MKAILYIYCDGKGIIDTFTIPIAVRHLNYTREQLLDLYDPTKLIGQYADEFNQLNSTHGFSNWHIVEIPR